LNKLRMTILRAGLFLLFSSLLSAGELFSSDYVVQGEGLTLFILPGEGDAYKGGEVSLAQGDGGVACRSQFFLYSEEGEESQWCALLGIPSDLEEGTYTLSCVMNQTDGVEQLQKRLGVRGREFPSEILELNTNLTNIRTQEDPVKTAQAQKLWSQLAAFEEDDRYNFGSIVPPLDDYRVTTDYGCRRVYQYNDGSKAGSIHNGWDWAAPTGTPIKAVGKGRVVMAEDRIVTGNTVILELLPGVYVLYYHLDELKCAEGDMVEPKQIIGTLGMTGLATGPHLHWEMRISRVAVDPLPFLEGDLIDKTLYLTKISDTL
jgi:hypothetical protein